MYNCRLCPRRCGAERTENRFGYCGVGEELTVAKIMLHKWEEPCISGDRGSGAVFFAGCSLKCVYCQNRDISFGGQGRRITPSELERAVFDLIERGAHNINFVTPTHFTQALLPLLEKIKRTTDIPIIWNTSGYECPETLDMLDGLVDVYLPDYKYAKSELAERLSSANDYPAVALEAIKRMVKQRGTVRISSDGMMISGVMIRHLVLPGYRQNSIDALGLIASNIGTDKIYLSLMCQYTPDFYIKNKDATDKNLRRKLTSFEYQRVAEYAERLGFVGYMQERGSADAAFTPDFEI